MDWLRSRPSSLDGLRSLLSYLCGRRRLWALALVRRLYARRRSLLFSLVGRLRLTTLVLARRRGWRRRILRFPFVALRVRCGASADYQ